MSDNAPGAARAEPSTPAGRRPQSEHPSGDDRFALVDKHLKRVHHAQDQLIETPHVAQDVFGFLSDDVLLYVARALRLPPSTVYGVATFYHLFTFESPGDHSCTVCTGTACFVKGADDIVSAVAGAYGVRAGDTSADGHLTLKTARCLGSCSLAPLVVLDGDALAHQTARSTLDRLDAVIAADVAAGEPVGGAA
jgi:bidirectional [NiFe] hydrogenase diaphorase subunit